MIRCHCCEHRFGPPWPADRVSMTPARRVSCATPTAGVAATARPRFGVAGPGATLTELAQSRPARGAPASIWVARGRSGNSLGDVTAEVESARRAERRPGQALEAVNPAGHAPPGQNK
jgi:hypothetical protein